MVECFNRTLEAQLSKFVEDHQQDWDLHLPLLLMAYRTAVREATGCTPACLMLGRDLRLPIDLVFGRPEDEMPNTTTIFSEELGKRPEQVHEFARANLKVATDRMKERYDSMAEDTPQEKGEPVWAYIPQRKKGISPKLMHPWKGPYLVFKRINDLVYCVQLTPRSKPKVLHCN